MSRRNTANSLLAEVIQFMDSKYAYPITKDLDNYETKAGSLRFKIDRYLNKKDYNYEHINKKLAQAQQAQTGSGQRLTCSNGVICLPPPSNTVAS